MKKLLLLTALSALCMQADLQAAAQPTAKELREWLWKSSEPVNPPRNPPLDRAPGGKTRATSSLSGLLAELRQGSMPLAAVPAPSPSPAPSESTTDDDSSAPQAAATIAAADGAQDLPTCLSLRKLRTPHGYKIGDVVTGVIIDIISYFETQPHRARKTKGIRLGVKNSHTGFIYQREIPTPLRGPQFTRKEDLPSLPSQEELYKKGQILNARIIAITPEGEIQLSLIDLPTA